jgi:hypothetical protein
MSRNSDTSLVLPNAIEVGPAVWLAPPVAEGIPVGGLPVILLHHDGRELLDEVLDIRGCAGDHLVDGERFLRRERRRVEGDSRHRHQRRCTADPTQANVVDISHCPVCQTGL